MMEHIDEHTLELFVLGSEKVRSETGRIREHLAVCQGCRTLCEEMEKSWGSVEASFRELQEHPEATGRSVERFRPAAGLTYAEPAAPARSYRPITRYQEVQYFVRRHPVMTGSGAFGALALLSLLFWVPLRGTKTINPVAVRSNVERGVLEVYGADHEKLWEVPVAGLAETKAGEVRGLAYASLVDLDGDGKNELVTSLGLADLGRASTPTLSVFSPEKSLQRSWRYEQMVVFDGREYAPPFGSWFLLTGDFTGTGSREIIVKVDDGRSPNGLIRYSADGGILGEYWHYGLFHSLYAADVDGDGKPEVIVTGQNDRGEKEGDRFAFLAVLDPARLRGRTASACTPGFDMPRSEAELLYMRFPQTDMNTALHSGGFILNVTTGGTPGRTIRSVWFSGGGDATGVLLLEYLLDQDFRCTRARSTDRTDRLHEILVAQGKVSGTLDSVYLQNLRRRVRYFDGRMWTDRVVWMAPPS